MEISRCARAIVMICVPIVALAGCSPVQAPAKENAPAPPKNAAEAQGNNPREELQNALQTLKKDLPPPVDVPAQPQDIKQADVSKAGPVVEATLAQARSAESVYYEVLGREIADLRMDVARIEGKLNVYMEDYVASLRSENLDLQREIQRLNMTHQNDYSSTGPYKPIPGRTYAEAPTTAEQNSAAPNENAGGENPQDQPITAIASSDGVNYMLVKEWGRNAVEAARAGAGVPSLKGLIGAVPPNTPEDDLVKLGQQLRVEFNDYDNINVTLFDNGETASTYAKTNKMVKDPVLNIVKYPSEGRDDILVRRSGILVKIAADGSVLPIPDAKPGAVASKMPAAQSATQPKASAVSSEEDEEIQRRAKAVLDRIKGIPLTKAPAPKAQEESPPTETAPALDDLSK